MDRKYPEQFTKVKKRLNLSSVNFSGCRIIFILEKNTISQLIVHAPEIIQTNWLSGTWRQCDKKSSLHEYQEHHKKFNI